MLHRVVVGVGVVVALAAALTISPVAAASTRVDKTSVCRAYKANETKQAKANAKLRKELESGTWAADKKALLATVTEELNAEKKFSSGYLRGASSKVKEAVTRKDEAKDPS